MILKDPPTSLLLSRTQSLEPWSVVEIFGAPEAPVLTGRFDIEAIARGEAFALYRSAASRRPALRLTAARDENLVGYTVHDDRGGDLGRVITGLDLFKEPDFHLFDSHGRPIGDMDSGGAEKLDAPGLFGRIFGILSPFRRPRAETYRIALDGIAEMTILPDAEDSRDPRGVGDRFSAAVDIGRWPADTNSDFLLGAMAIFIAHHAPAGAGWSVDALWVAGNLAAIS